jgi:hypothetical protein
MSEPAAVAPGWFRRTGGRIRRAKLRTRVLAGVLLVTLVALATFDVAGVTALRTYLVSQTASQLREVLGLYRMRCPRSGKVSVRSRPAGTRASA